MTYQEITERYLKLLGVDSLPGLPENEGFFIQSMTRMLNQHGEKWVRQSASYLIDQWEYLVKGFL